MVLFVTSNNYVYYLNINTGNLVLKEYFYTEILLLVTQVFVLNNANELSTLEEGFPSNDGCIGEG